MFIMTDVIKFEIKNDDEATWKFIRHLHDSPNLKNNRVGGLIEMNCYTAYFKSEAREELTRYITNEISKSDN